MVSHWIENDIIINGVQIHYTRTGGKKKPPLVLLHGFSDSGMCWLPVARDLEAEWDIILPDARGHGKSQRVQPGEKIDSAADIAGLIQELKLNRPVVGGHSMGGNTAGLVGSRYPDLVRGLILEDPGWRAAPPPRMQAKEGEETPPPPNPWFEWLLRAKDTPIDKVMEKCRADSPTWAEIELRPWAESKINLDTNVFQAESVWVPWEEVARSIVCPTLLLTGDVDKGSIVSEEDAQHASQLSPAIRVAHIPGVGHNLRRENYPVFMRLVGDLLNNLHG
ncbi:MAG: alpha/beta hydrolase [Anaerolineaceae bacterium]|nr:alpha/beta hydrolase [Anaerolineaceae bacterium]